MKSLLWVVGIFLFCGLAHAEPEKTIYLFYIGADGKLTRFEYRQSEASPLPDAPPGYTISTRNTYWTTPQKGFDFFGYLVQQGLAVKPGDEKPDGGDKNGDRRAPGFFSHAWSGTTWLFWSALNLAKDYWSVFFGVGIIVGLFRWFNKRRAERAMRLVFAGDPDVGKSVLWTALADVESPKGYVPTQREREQRGEWVEISNVKFTPILHDTPGERPGDVTNAIKTNPAIETRLGIDEKYVLLFVIAPFRGESGRPDEGFLAEQRGALRMFLNMIASSRSLVQPDACVLFINKIDGIQDGGESVSASTKQAAHMTFKSHIEFFVGASKAMGIPNAVVAGSALKRWETAELTNTVARLLNKR